MSGCSFRQPLLVEFFANFKLIYTKRFETLMYQNSENIETDRADTVLFNLPQIKERNLFWDNR